MIATARSTTYATARTRLSGMSRRGNASTRSLTAVMLVLYRLRTVINTNNTTPNARYASTRALPSEPVKPEVGALFDPSGPVISASMRLPRMHATKRRTLSFSERSRQRVVRTDALMRSDPDAHREFPSDG